MFNSLKHLHPWSRICAGLASAKSYNCFNAMLRMPQCATCSCHPANAAWACRLFAKNKEPWGTQGSFHSKRLWGSGAYRCSVGAAVAAAEERPEPIVQTNFEHLNLAARRESVSPERPRSKREVIEFEKVIFKLRRPISP